MQVTGGTSPHINGLLFNSSGCAVCVSGQNFAWPCGAVLCWLASLWVRCAWSPNVTFDLCFTDASQARQLGQMELQAHSRGCQCVKGCWLEVVPLHPCRNFVVSWWWDVVECCCHGLAFWYWCIVFVYFRWSVKISCRMGILEQQDGCVLALLPVYWSWYSHFWPHPCSGHD